MRKLGCPWTIKLAALGLAVAVTGCDSSKSGKDNEPSVGGTSAAAGNGSGGKASFGGSYTTNTLRGGSTSSNAGGASQGGAFAGGPSVGGALAGGPAVGGALVGGAPQGGASTNVAGSAPVVGGTTASGGRSTVIIAGAAGTAATCVASADCAANAEGKKLCSVPTGECVQCLAASDCMVGAAGAAGAPSTVPNTLACVKNACVSYTACVNSLGCTLGQVCNTTLGYCVQCSSNADCVTGTKCGQNQCRTNCTSDKDCTPLGLLCNASAGYCVSCNYNTDCPANRYCSNGECVRDNCVASSTRCQGNAISTCATDGSAWSSASSCASSRTCTTSAGGSAICQPWACNPSTTGCALTEEKVVSCPADGITATVLDDCAAKGQVCVSGACAPVVCKAGARFCQDGAVRTCSAKGDSSTLSSTCSAGYYCDATSATCKTQVCTPSQPICNGTIATTCDPLGAGFITGGTDCSTNSSAPVCSLGVCQAQLCTPSALYCDNGVAPNVIRSCAATGSSSSLSSTCSSSAYCDASSGTPTCKTRVCTPGAAVCNGTVATKCNSLGSGYVDGGTDCPASGLICNATTGTCQNLVCSPYSYFCDATTTPNTVRYCASTGLTSSLSLTCGTNQYCDSTTTTSACKTQVCTPNQPTCTPNNVATTCNAQGSGYVAGGTDCTGTANPVCSQGVCSNAVVDTIDSSAASASQGTGPYTFVNFYSVDSSRTLTQIEIYLNPGSTTNLTWTVWEATSQTGTYTSKLSVTSSASVGAGYKSSGAINVALRAGYYYAIATTWPSVGYYFRNSSTGIKVSFGTMTLGFATTGSIVPTTMSYPSASSSPPYFPQRLTTTL